MILLLLADAAPSQALQLTSEEQAFLQQKKQIFFVSQTQYPPFEFYDENGQHEGIMIDVVRWMAIEMGFKPVLVTMSFQKAQEAVLSGDVDVLTSLFLSEKRKERFSFTEPLFDVPASIFVRTERTDMKALQDLNGKVIAIQRGDYAKEFLDTNGIQYQMLTTENFAQATDAVISGQADAVIGDEQIVFFHIYKNRLTQEIKKIGTPLYIGQNCMASRPENTLLIEILNKGIAEARATGMLEKINEKWLGKGFGHSKSFFEAHQMAVLASFAGIVLLFLAVWFWNVQLRRTVRRQTEILLTRENALRESERNFRTFFETMDDLVFVGAPDGKILYTNPAVSRKLGFRPEELEAMHILDVHPAEKRREAQTIFSAMLQNGMSVCPLPLQSREGSLLPVETRTWIGKWNGVDCIYGICKDLRKEQEALQLFNRIFERNPAVMSISRTSDGIFIDINEAFEKAFGYGREEIIGKTVFEIDLFVDPEKHREARAQLKRDGRLFDVELQVKCKDGSHRDGLFYGEIIESQGQQLFLTVMIDQTRRKQAEKVLMREYTFRNAIIEYIAEGLCVCHQISMAPYIRFTIWNENMIRITGYTREEVNDAGWYPLMAPDEGTGIRGTERIQQSFQRIDLRNEEWPIVRKDGQPRWLSISTSVVETDGGTVHVLGLVQDITEQKRMEAERQTMEQRLQQIEKAESLSRMAGAIAHHFNNQLMVILGNLDMAAEDCRENENSHRSFVAMRKAVQKAAEISHLMLIYLGQSFGQKESVDLSEVCKEHLQVIEADLPRQIRLNLQFPEPGPKALVNVKHMNQVLVHLITNAAEAIGDQAGTIRVGIRETSGAEIPTIHRYPLDRQPSPEASYACIVVSDTGCGIDEADINRIMDPFFTSKFTGRGMGLAFVLGIVRGHDGFLCVESERGKGSTFQMFLPVIEAPVSINPDRKPRRPEFQAEGVVLLVEDEALVRDVTETILKRLGFSVVCTSNGVEAVQVFEKTPERFRLVISDVAMPIMDGWETLSAMRRIRPDIPVILASGYNEANVLAGKHEELPQAILEKPYHIQDLMGAIRKIVAPTSS
ncbi:PAS domain S-box protein [Desulfatirhabdium butyrativorans]|uniref:PAS domain S-box protein n=1 Tax=Desulfatirhabdium butyrativorans TaxID=340467 RepID=UPI000480E667|nr:PAS domain S-box protein [Desulfatirhabdium butyrativorans]